MPGSFVSPYFGMNLRDIPGTDYPLGKIFGYLPHERLQSVPLLVVVSHRVQVDGCARQTGTSALRRHQLSREYLV